MSLLLSPFLIILAIAGFLQPHIYRVGDFRDDIVFRLLFFGFFIALNLAGIVLSIRWLRNNRRGPTAS